MIQIGKKDRGRAQGPLARAKMLEGRGDVALFANPVLELGIHERTLPKGL